MPHMVAELVASPLGHVLSLGSRWI